MPPGEFGEDLLPGHAHPRRAAHHGRLRQYAPQPLRRRQHLIQHFRGDGKYPTLRSRFESEAVDVAAGYMDDAHRPQHMDPSLKGWLSAAALDQQNLMQPRTPVRCGFPFVQNRSRRNGLAMHEVGQVARLAEQVVGPNSSARRGLGHVQIIQDRRGPAILTSQKTGRFVQNRGRTA